MKCSECGRHRRDLDRWGYCPDCIRSMREDFEKGLLEDYLDKHEPREIPNEYPEPAELREQYPVGD